LTVNYFTKLYMAFKGAVHYCVEDVTANTTGHAVLVLQLASPHGLV